MLEALPSLWLAEREAVACVERLSYSGADQSDLERFLRRRDATREGATGGRHGRVTVLPVTGFLSHRGAWWSDTSIVDLRAAFAAAMLDPTADAIVLDIDSDGGALSGVPEFASDLLAARGTKPIIASINSRAVSGAYWIASAADEITITPSGSAGSIGVFALHLDRSEQNAKLGLAPTYIHAGKYKVESNADSPLTAEARAHMQERVRDTYQEFVRAVARGRGVRPSVVIGDYGQGRALSAKRALRAGMVDRIETLEKTITRLGGSGRRTKPTLRAEWEARRRRW